MSNATRSYILIAASVLLSVAGVWHFASVQRSTAEHGYLQLTASQRMLTSMLDQQSSLRAYALTQRSVYLDGVQASAAQFGRAVTSAGYASRDDAAALALLNRQVDYAQAWQRTAQVNAQRLEALGKRGVVPANVVKGTALMNRFRAGNAEFRARVAARAGEEIDSARLSAVLAILLINGLFAVIGYATIWRSSRRARLRSIEQRRYQETQAEFIETLQIAESSREAYDLLRRHLERSLAGAKVFVFNRNRSDDRLDAATPVPEGSPLAVALDTADQHACLAVRLGQRHDRGNLQRPLLECGVCGKIDGAASCHPLIIGGQVMGSVLVQREQPLDDDEQRRVRESVLQAAPVLANLRNLELAEERAATDGLTGLPNARSVRETLVWMIAQTNRTLDPMSAIMLDLDRFKQINDVYGHAKGDEALVAVAGAIRESVRGSDFAGRTGGEEFLVLLPATGPEGAERVAQNMRKAIAHIRIQGLDRELTASFGIASLPEHASDGDGLLRIADRALYMAKARGRNRVEVAPLPGNPEGGALVALPTRMELHDDD